jgi:hypothetical protein
LYNILTIISYRFFSICSSYENFHVQLELFREVFTQNGYPTRLFNRCVRLFLDKVFQPKTVVHSVPKKVMYICLPLTGSHSLQHLNNTGHTASLDDFKIISSCPSSDEYMTTKTFLFPKLNLPWMQQAVQSPFFYSNPFRYPTRTSAPFLANITL